MEPEKHLAQLADSSCLIQRSTYLYAVVTMRTVRLFSHVCTFPESRSGHTGGAVYTRTVGLLLNMCVHRHRHTHTHLAQGYAVGRMHTLSLSNAAGWGRWFGHLGNGQYLASLGQLWFKRKESKH